VVALTHHEKWDGSGYPASLKGEDIPLWGRIVALADVMDSLLSQRPYKEPLDFEQALQYIRRSAGRHFDPALADLVLNNPDIFKDITFRYTSSTVLLQQLVGN
jgi:putative two-component system response regulator